MKVGRKCIPEMGKRLAAVTKHPSWSSFNMEILKALREPTEAMICAGDAEIIAALNDHDGVRRDPTPAHSAWRAMIDVAMTAPNPSKYPDWRPDSPEILRIVHDARTGQGGATSRAAALLELLEESGLKIVRK